MTTPTLADRLAEVLTCCRGCEPMHGYPDHAVDCGARLRPAVLALLLAVRREALTAALQWVPVKDEWRVRALLEEPK